jgi:hypothetical protein
VRARREADQIVLALGPNELSRLAAVLAEATTSMSRAEFFIRVGCSLSNIEELVRALELMASGKSTEFEMTIVAGSENVENPPRPRRNLGG